MASPTKSRKLTILNGEVVSWAHSSKDAAHPCVDCGDECISVIGHPSPFCQLAEPAAGIGAGAT
jgi:hypothetical protein